MGKSKLRRTKLRQLPPTGLPSMKELEQSEELIPQFENTILESVIEKLQSSGADDKECAACTIANMAENSEFVSALIEQKVIKLIAPLLLDSNLSVRHTIAGCLRNLSVCGGHEISQAMVEQDVMTVLVTLLQQYKESWTPVKSSDGIDSKSEIFAEVCNLLWNLCESSNTAVTIFNSNKIIFILLQCLDIESFGLQIPLVVAQCLHTIAEDNPEAIETLSQPMILEQLNALISLKPVEPEHALLKIVAAGILLSVHSGKLENCLTAITTALMEAVSNSLSIPILPDIEKVAKEIKSYKAEKLNKYREEGALEQKLAERNKTFKCLDHILPAKQVALEILTNICFGDDPNDWEDQSGSDSSEEAFMDIDENSSTPCKVIIRVPHEISSIIVHNKLLEKVLQQMVVPSTELSQVLKETSEGQRCLKSLNSVRYRALFCLNNMVQSLDLEDLGGASVLFDLWLKLGNMVFKETDISDTDQLEAATSSMRAVLQKLAETDCSSQFSKMTEQDLELLVNTFDKSQDPAVKVNIIRSVGTIGCLLGNNQQSSPPKLVNVIGTFLLEVCAKSSDLWVIAEALDIIFDVFAEDHLDDIACEISLVEKLSLLLPQLKGKIKQQKKSLGEHLPVIRTAKTNLLRFVKYKNERRNK